MDKLGFESDEKPEVRIEDWQIYGNQIWGKAYGHPRFDDGTPVRTSEILKREGNRVETHNTIYTLGKEFEAPDLPDEHKAPKGVS